MNQKKIQNMTLQSEADSGQILDGTCLIQSRTHALTYADRSSEKKVWPGWGARPKSALIRPTWFEDIGIKRSATKKPGKYSMVCIVWLETLAQLIRNSEPHFLKYNNIDI